MIVKHRKGSFRSQWHATARLWAKFIWLRLMGNKVAIVELVFGMDSTYNQNSINQMDWLKAFGCKSGINTPTNSEHIAAYRYLPKKNTFQVCLYKREPNKGFTVVDLKSAELKGIRVSFQIKVPLTECLPVGAWAGGDQAPEEDFQYQLKIY